MVNSVFSAFAGVQQKTQRRCCVMCVGKQGRQETNSITVREDRQYSIVKVDKKVSLRFFVPRNDKDSDSVRTFLILKTIVLPTKEAS